MHEVDQTTEPDDAQRPREGETVARFAFLHPDTGMDLVREILARTE